MPAYILCSFSDKLVLHLSQELKRLQRRKAMMSSEGSLSHSSSGSGSGPGSPGCSKEQPLFTLKQVSGTVRLHLIVPKKVHKFIVLKVFHFHAYIFDPPLNIK